jgi:cadmium resistance protein CadD (predicted permease)
MGLIDTLILLVTGFVAFFATGVDDTVAYAGLYLNNGRKDHKILISLGIILGTFIALIIAIFAGSAMQALPSRHLIGGAVLVSLGIIMFFRGKWSKHKKTTHMLKVKKHIRSSKAPKFKSIKFVGLGMTLFFATGIDDMIAYSNLIMAKGSWMAICIGVLIATFIALIIAHFLSKKLKKFPHPEKIGAVIMIIIGVLLALKIL